MTQTTNALLSENALKEKIQALKRHYFQALARHEASHVALIKAEISDAERELEHVLSVKRKNVLARQNASERAFYENLNAGERSLSSLEASIPEAKELYASLRTILGVDEVMMYETDSGPSLTVRPIVDGTTKTYFGLVSLSPSLPQAYAIEFADTDALEVFVKSVTVLKYESFSNHVHEGRGVMHIIELFFLALKSILLS